jgi:iron complex outermembrane receptor protein
MPETVANLFTVYALETMPLTFTGTVRHEGRTFLDNGNTVRVNGRTTLDASVGYRFRIGELTLRGRNLTDRLYADGASPSVNQVVLGPPRTVDLTFTLRYR